ncbi:hypothetical protein DKG77_01585 [Flagellimonas aquimarina]|uniref:Uncharacterized protein n=1 Tax=Flagellimonas aquimarina TaxID=2201895 RepID=A0A316L5L1_9FLAO|nr:hypothetical protein [Allomuricauda koreensis]PWL39553.1 hypothetical protein DKG77_01585 [Allomuricauda koreensis]
MTFRRFGLIPFFTLMFNFSFGQDIYQESSALSFSQEEIENTFSLLWRSKNLNYSGEDKKWNQLFSLVDDEITQIGKNYKLNKQSAIANQKNLLFEGVNRGGILNADDQYLEFPTPDKMVDETDNKDDFKKFVVPVITYKGNKVDVNFGITESDSLNANQKVKPILIDALTEVLTETNRNLDRIKAPLIKSIYIKATTNGNHGKSSNHYSGNAVDISRINGEYMINYGYSLILFMSNLQKIELADSLMKKDSEKEDMVYLYQRILQLQVAMQNYKYRRENFGPIIRTKLRREKLKKNEKDSKRANSFSYKVKGHFDHVHFSVRK